MSSSDGKDDPNGGNWPWSDQTFLNMQADHERFMNQHKADARHGGINNETLPSPSHDGSDGASHSPFAMFKKFVDDNFNTLTEGFRNFPSNLAEVRARMQLEQEARKREEMEISRRWTGSSDSPDHIRMEVERSTREEQDAVREAVTLLLNESVKRNQDVPVHKIIDLYADPQSRFGDLDRFATPMLSWGGACYYMPETGDNLPSTRSWGWTGTSALRWLSVDWFKRSPYSPVRLEAHPEAGAHGTKWRAAFEDLLNAALDKPMKNPDQVGQRPPFGVTQSSLHGPGLDWMLSLQCRGILPPQLPRLYNDIRLMPGMRQKTVLELLDRRLVDAPWSGGRSFASSNPISQDYADLMSVVGIKSTSEESPQTMTDYRVLPSMNDFETEQDLYERQYACLVPRIEDLEHDFNEALTAGDFPLLEKIIDRSSTNSDTLPALLKDHIIDLVTTSHIKPSPIWTKMLLNALQSSKQEVLEHPWTICAIEVLDRILELDTFSSEEKIHRRKLIENLEDIYNRRGKDPREFHADVFEMSTEEVDEFLKQKLTEDRLTESTVEQSPSTKHIPESTTSTNLQKPDVLSALTTTHTVRLPDGTVTTKVVLKQRFADGREETHESVHITNESTDQKSEKEKEKEKESPKKKGSWFWS